MSFVVVIVLSQGGVKCIVDHEDLDLDCLHAHRDAPCVPRRLPRVLREERRRLVQVSEIRVSCLSATCMSFVKDDDVNCMFSLSPRPLLVFLSSLLPFC